MVRATSGVQLKVWKRAKDLMLIVGFFTLWISWLYGKQCALAW